MKWEKIKQIYIPEGEYSHGANPVAVWLTDSVYRIYFNVRDNNSKSYITYLDYDIQKHEIVFRALNPVVFPGELGCFDDSGCSLGSIVRISEEMEYIYYLGWNLSVTVPWRNSIGLVIHNLKEDTYTKYSRAPILDRSEVDPFSISYPFVMKRENCFQMWYGSCLDWGGVGRGRWFAIKYGVSSDGISWEPTGKVCISGPPPSGSVLIGCSRPSVILDNNIYRMWYSYRGEKYRIGYAESQDGLDWVRKDDEVGIGISDHGFDSEEIGYPMVFAHDGKLFMLFCGNGYGKTGFGIAELVEDE